MAAEATRLAATQRLSATAGLWNHAFVVLDRRVRAGRDQIVIVESTRIPVAHRALAGARGHPGWEGPQWSILVSRDPGESDAMARGQCNRRACRRYRLDAWAPNVALLDPGLSGGALRTLQRRARATLRPAWREQWALRVEAHEARLTSQGVPSSTFEADDVLSGAYVAELYAGLVPELSPLAGGDGPLAAGRMYEALRHRGLVAQRVGSPTLPRSAFDTGELADALGWMDGPALGSGARRPASAARVRVPDAGRRRASPTPA